MEIVGRGFIATNLATIANRHPDAVVLAAGVSSAVATSDAAFRRERELVEKTVERCGRERRRLVFFSTASSGMYGAPGCTGREDDPVTPRSPYAEHKWQLERLIQLSGTDYLVARLSHLVGAHQRPHQLIPALVGQLRTGRIQIRSGTRRDLLEVRDMVRITDALLSGGVSRQVVNIASGVPVPIEVIVDYLELRLGLFAEREYLSASDGGFVSIDKLHRLVSGFRFAAGYHREALGAYLDSLKARP
ncbi:NAD-dependent epimerase/dehydratase family protein [Streptomyces rimosus]|uniref:NAD-dependent epimerase/dehydratase family protein n=1 Tax=Streptomyces rimosus TaxID=1927 RepID=UPI0004C22D5A|nr:NAD-dependent epimerase/dehydratase family protein [Streptomyces rimosus]